MYSDNFYFSEYFFYDDERCSTNRPATITPNASVQAVFDRTASTFEQEVSNGMTRAELWGYPINQPEACWMAGMWRVGYEPILQDWNPIALDPRWGKSKSTILWWSTDYPFDDLVKALTTIQSIAGGVDPLEKDKHLLIIKPRNSGLIPEALKDTGIQVCDNFGNCVVGPSLWTGSVTTFDRIQSSARMSISNV